MTKSNDTLKVGSTVQTTVEAKVVAQVDVVVAGGGTAGVIAAIAAARNGASVILLERRGYLGGMMTGGNIGLTKYTVYEKDLKEDKKIHDILKTDPASVQVVGGIPLELTERLIRKKAALGTHGNAGTYVFTAAERFKLELLEMMEEAGVKLMLHSLLVDVIKSDNRVEAVVVENKSGRQIIAAKAFIDATGDGDLAARAGAPFVMGVAESDISAKNGIKVGSMQPMGVMYRIGNMDLPATLDFLRDNPQYFAVQNIGNMDFDEVCQSYAQGEMTVFYIKGLSGSQPGRTKENRTIQFYNTPLPGVFTCCCPMVNGSGVDVEDLTKAEIAMAKMVHQWVQDMRDNIPGCENIYLLDCPEIGVRETRHFRGEYVLNAEDIFTARKFEDTIGRGAHPIDISPIPEELKDVEVGSRWYFNIPYRSLIPLELDNVLLAGRNISCTHEASGCVRTSSQCMVIGQAAGTAAAMCAAENTPARKLDAQKLRQVLREQKALI